LAFTSGTGGAGGTTGGAGGLIGGAGVWAAGAFHGAAPGVGVGTGFDTPGGSNFEDGGVPGETPSRPDPDAVIDCEPGCDPDASRGPTVRIWLPGVPGRGVTVRLLSGEW
jgi:hypothetical protein